MDSDNATDPATRLDVGAYTKAPVMHVRAQDDLRTWTGRSNRCGYRPVGPAAAVGECVLDSRFSVAAVRGDAFRLRLQ